LLSVSKANLGAFCFAYAACDRGAVVIRATATIGAAYQGANGAVLGMAIAPIIGSLIWWRNFAKALREHGAVPTAIGPQTTMSVRAFSRQQRIRCRVG
jgi:hypothetical protein